MLRITIKEKHAIIVSDDFPKLTAGGQIDG